MDIRIAIASHKEFNIPTDEMYLPLQVGAAGKDTILGICTVRSGGTSVRAVEMQRDDEGDNISEQNELFSELTGLYWIWKNLHTQYSGLVHYRRHFVDPHTRGSHRSQYERILTRPSLETFLQQTDIVLPRKRNYYIESIYSHYAHSHYEEHLQTTREILSRRCPEYLPAYDKVMKGTKAHMFNMFIMRKEKLDEYCAWLFPILFELVDRTDYEQYDSFQKRFPGRISELLLDVWIDTNALRYHELPVMMIGKVKWGHKLMSFLSAKFLGKRYTHGF